MNRTAGYTELTAWGLNKYRQFIFFVWTEKHKFQQNIERARNQLR